MSISLFLLLLSVGHGEDKAVQKAEYLEQFVNQQILETWLNSLLCNYAKSELLETLFKQISCL